MEIDKIKNLELWEIVKTTPKERTKKINAGGREITTINAQWQIMVATAVWGKYGHTWGVKSLHYQYLDFPSPIKENVNGKWATVGYENKMCCLLDAVFYYPDGEFELSTDSTVLAGDDHRKKLLTDLTTKALSKLGFSADVFLGQHDSKY